MKIAPNTMKAPARSPRTMSASASRPALAAPAASALSPREWGLEIDGLVRSLMTPSQA
jgi:hypothetical protein